MKSLQDHLTEYVAARRALGTRLQEPAQTLRRFIAFLARRERAWQAAGERHSLKPSEVR